jgi:hypothetical protein
MHVLLSDIAVPRDCGVHRAVGVIIAGKHVWTGLLADNEVDK